ncbi:MAG: dUTP diphosphatase [Chloroflexi bacterium]|nr:dUTP diphosphatase [Chloroflexota bacterium]
MARVRENPSRAEQLAVEPTISAEARAELAQGAAEWDAKQFFDAHETWEEIWQVERRSIRSFYQGLILLAAGLHHWTGTHRPRGVRIKLASGIERLAAFAPSYLGVDVSTMIAEAATLLRQAPDDPAALADTPPDRFPPFRWAVTNGGEPGLQYGALRVRRLRAAAQLPTRGSELASGLDLYAELSELGGAIMLGQMPQAVPTGIACAPPPGCEIQIRPRSGLTRRGVEIGWGTVDADYRGELLVSMCLRGPAGRGYRITQGDRIAQLVVAPVVLARVEEVEELEQTERGGGGFGSTGR